MPPPCDMLYESLTTSVGLYVLSDTIAEATIASQYSIQFGSCGAKAAHAPTMESTRRSRVEPTGKYLPMFAAAPLGPAAPPLRLTLKPLVDALAIQPATRATSVGSKPASPPEAPASAPPELDVPEPDAPPDAPPELDAAPLDPPELAPAMPDEEPGPPPPEEPEPDVDPPPEPPELDVARPPPSPPPLASLPPPSLSAAPPPKPGVLAAWEHDATNATAPSNAPARSWTILHRFIAGPPSLATPSPGAARRDVQA